MTDVAPYARRMTVNLDDAVVCCTVPAGVEPSKVLREVQRAQEQVIRGFSRPLIFNDGKFRGRWHKFRDAWFEVEKLFRVAWRHTVAFPQTYRELKALRRNFRAGIR
jgi:hypothetical protein